MCRLLQLAARQGRSAAEKVPAGPEISRNASAPADGGGGPLAPNCFAWLRKHGAMVDAAAARNDGTRAAMSSQRVRHHQRLRCERLCQRLVVCAAAGGGWAWELLLASRSELKGEAACARGRQGGRRVLPSVSIGIDGSHASVLVHVDCAPAARWVGLNV